MASSNDRSDKFAFLLSGTINSRFEADLKMVCDTLIEYYNFPANHIWVSYGGALTTVTFQAGVHTKLIASSADLAAEILAFKTAASDQDAANYPTSSEKNTALIYMTGESIQATGYYKITNGGATVATDWFSSGNFANVNDSLCELLFVLQQSYSDGVRGKLFDLLHDGCVISSNATTDENHLNAAGSYFTIAWTNGLKMLPEPAGSVHIGTYADTLGSGTESTDFLISMSESCQYALETNTTSPLYEYLTHDYVYTLGQPSFLIQDSPTPAWWESPDLDLTHPNSSDITKHNDLFVTDADDAEPDFNNTINCVIRNVGTHPVRAYRIGIKVYRTPSGGALDTIEENGHVPVGAVLKPSIKSAYNTFLPDNNDVYTWNTIFKALTTHECLWAKVMLPTDNIVAHPFDWSYNVTGNFNEAQRNTDPGSDPPRTSSSKLPGNSFRGVKKHIYQIRNPFRETYKFIFTTLPEYQQSLQKATMKWSVENEKKKWMKITPEKIDKGFYGIAFTLKTGESREIIGEFGFKPGVKKGLKVRLPVEVVVNKIEGSKTRQPQAPSLKDKFAALAGFTIILTNEPADLICIVVDNKGKPLPGGTVNIQTINGFAVENIKANDKGEVILRKINPDVYRITAELKGAKSKEKIVELTGGQSLTVKLEIIPLKKKG